MDPIGWDYAHMMNEIGEELRAHGDIANSKQYFARAEAWLAPKVDQSASFRLRHLRILVALARFDEAQQQLEILRRVDSANVEYLGIAGIIHARKNMRTRATAVMDSLASRRQPYEFGVNSLYRARIAALIGDRPTSVAALRDAFASGRSYDLGLHRDIDLESLKGYGPFDQLLKGRE